jgi:hypothetical protein
MALHSQGGSNPGRKGQPPLQIALFDSVSTSRREFATARTFEVPTIEASLLAVRRESRIRGGEGHRCGLYGRARAKTGRM